MVWSTVTIGDYLVNTELRDPTKQPGKRFFYVDVSSVDNQAFAIRQPTELLGADAPSRARKVIRERDVLFATVRPTLRRIALVDSALNDQVCSTGFCVLRPGPTLDAGFLYYWLLTDDVLQHVAKIEKGVSYPSIRDSDVKAIRIPYPPLDEQMQIAAVSSAVQRAIERQERLIALTDELKKTLMHRLFTEGTRGEPLKHTEIGPVPESWRVVSIRQECVDCAFGPRFSSKEYVPDGAITTLRTTDMDDDGNIDYTPAPRANLDLTRFSSHFLRIGDIVVSRSGTCGIASVFEGYERPVVPGAFLIRLRMRGAVWPQYLRHYLNSAQGRARTALIAEGAIQKNISGTRLQDFLVPLPSHEEQIAIAAAIDNVARAAVVHQQRKGTLEQLFRTLLHQLMTGKVRVHDLDLSALEEAAQELVGAV